MRWLGLWKVWDHITQTSQQVMHQSVYVDINQDPVEVQCNLHTLTHAIHWRSPTARFQFVTDPWAKVAPWGGWWLNISSKDVSRMRKQKTNKRKTKIVNANTVSREEFRLIRQCQLIRKNLPIPSARGWDYQDVSSLELIIYSASDDKWKR